MTTIAIQWAALPYKSGSNFRPLYTLQKGDNVPCLYWGKELTLKALGWTPASGWVVDTFEEGYIPFSEVEWPYPNEGDYKEVDEPPCLGVTYRGVAYAVHKVYARQGVPYASILLPEGTYIVPLDECGPLR